MPEYRPIQSAFGALWLHPCPALDYGPDWAQRECLLIDAGPRDSRLKFQGRSIPFHGHLFRKTDGSFLRRLGRPWTRRSVTSLAKPIASTPTPQAKTEAKQGQAINGIST